MEKRLSCKAQSLEKGPVRPAGPKREELKRDENKGWQMAEPK